MCHGFFGGYRTREFFCVNHMDCSLSFYEQDGISYECTLYGERHIPTKVIYDSRIDAFLLVSSYCELECYRYQDFGESADNNKLITAPVWSVCIGEYPLDMQIQQTSE